MRVVFLSDTHLGFDLPIRPRVQRYRRGERFFENLERVLDHATTTRADLARLSDRLLQIEAAITSARREIVTMGPDGYWDALVEIAPVGTAAPARPGAKACSRNSVMTKPA